MSIQKKFIVRHSEYGHVRFQIPDECVRETAARRLADKISRLDAVDRVQIYRKAKKLSIRFNESRCDFKQLAKALYQLIAELEAEGCFVENTGVSKRRARQKIGQQIKNSKVSRWFSDKYKATRETVQAAKIVTKVGMKGPKALINDPEKAIIDFLNDVLTLYLIKLHWTRITQEWIPRPFVHRYEWLATFYMFYLLIRSRRPQK